MYTRLLQKLSLNLSEGKKVLVGVIIMSLPFVILLELYFAFFDMDARSMAERFVSMLVVVLISCVFISIMTYIYRVSPYKISKTFILANHDFEKIEAIAMDKARRKHKEINGNTITYSARIKIRRMLLIDPIIVKKEAGKLIVTMPEPYVKMLHLSVESF